MLADSSADKTVAGVQPSTVEAPAAEPALDAAATGSSAQSAAAPEGESVAGDSRLASLETDPGASVAVAGHLYSKNPRASYVFIDGGRQVVAGQQITDELLLDEITPTGVVVEFHGYLIEVGVLQNWSLK